MNQAPGFLERMSTLLANAEVLGLFKGDSPEEPYKWFTGQVAKNLHVVFLMNPLEKGLALRAATSPALSTDAC
jgi:dynein heavy chain 1